MRMAARLQAMNIPKYQNLTRKSGGRYIWTGKIRCDYSALNTPLKWKKPSQIFVNSMSDLFHPEVPFFFIDKVWETMKLTPQHTYQILTKRPKVLARYLLSNQKEILPNVWLGTSVENDQVIDRINDIRNIPSVVRFISFEPLIGPIGRIDLSGIHWAIVGGESGPKSRPIEEWWVDEIQHECRTKNTAFFFKQWGGKNKKVTGRDYRGQIWNEYPQSLPA